MATPREPDRGAGGPHAYGGGFQRSAPAHPWPPTRTTTSSRWTRRSPCWRGTRRRTMSPRRSGLPPAPPPPVGGWFATTPPPVGFPVEAQNLRLGCGDAGPRARGPVLLSRRRREAGPAPLSLSRHPNLRRAFLRRVYGVLSAQLLLNVLVVAACMYQPALRYAPQIWVCLIRSYVVLPGVLFPHH